MKKIETILTLGIALTIIYISSNLSFFIWDNIAGYYLLTILASFFGGVLIVEFDSSLKLVATTFIVSAILFVFLFISPPMLYGESYFGEINSMVGVVTTELARTVIISFPISVFACLFGCFSGKSITERQ
jgi:hypothetical protein